MDVDNVARLPHPIHYCPVPDKYTVCGLLLASSSTTILAVLVPTSLGVKVTVIVQLVPAVIAFGKRGQLFVAAKSPAFVPAVAMLEIMCEALSLFVRTVVMLALVEPCICAAKPRLLGDTLMGATVGTTPAPG